MGGKASKQDAKTSKTGSTASKAQEHPHAANSVLGHTCFTMGNLVLKAYLGTLADGSISWEPTKKDWHRYFATIHRCNTLGLYSKSIRAMLKQNKIEYKLSPNALCFTNKRPFEKVSNPEPCYVLLNNNVPCWARSTQHQDNGYFVMLRMVQIEGEHNHPDKVPLNNLKPTEISGDLGDFKNFKARVKKYDEEKEE